MSRRLTPVHFSSRMQTQLASAAIFVLTILMSVESNAQDQKFHFGASLGFIASQVDGDDLKGFNKFGFQGGLLSGYSLNEHNWLVVELQYSSFGSAKRGEDADLNLEVGLQSINVLLGYSLRFLDTWDGEQKMRVIVGPKFQRLIEVDGPNLTKEQLKSLFVSANVGLSYIVTNAFIIDLTYTHGLANILKEPLSQADSLVPYYLTLGVSYYISKKD